MIETLERALAALANVDRIEVVSQPIGRGTVTFAIAHMRDGGWASRILADTRVAG